MPARHPVRPVRSGPSGLSGPGALGLGRWSGPDGPDRTGHGRHCALAKSSLAMSGPVRSVRSAPVPWAQDPRSPHLFLFEKRLSVAPKQAFGPKVMKRCSKTTFWTKNDGVLLQSNILLQKLWRVAPKHVFLQKWWSVAPKQAFAPKVMKRCSKTSFCSKRVAPKQACAPKVMECCSKARFCSKSDGGLLQNKLLLQK